ncbi:large conductance mechanosensitive channel [Geodermatophilus pulveris]|uniref:Large conductance mechanosensitive channel n=1 Tax=Geodermatophilus pulveris TaxID=1564159 RepID=A0A239GZM7_9ACTN|nr:MscL family protein [Geodermatophilus pulveris]SNS74676.1 large conductance mechanosensitive channel [Geodermatophilus pulveris]
MTPVLSGFEDFLLRGNVVELAVAVVIGTAFTAVVNTFAASFLTPLVGLVSGGGQLGGVFVVDGQAAVIYFLVVLPMKALVERRARGEGPGPARPTETELLAEIRGLLRAR